MIFNKFFIKNSKQQLPDGEGKPLFADAVKQAGGVSDQACGTSVSGVSSHAGGTSVSGVSDQAGGNGRPKNIKKPCLHISICTGEKVAGFKDMTTGKFEDIMLIRNDKDLKIFMKDYGIKSVEEFVKDY